MSGTEAEVPDVLDGRRYREVGSGPATDTGAFEASQCGSAGAEPQRDWDDDITLTEPCPQLTLERSALRRSGKGSSADRGVGYTAVLYVAGVALFVATVCLAAVGAAKLQVEPDDSVQDVEEVRVVEGVEVRKKVGGVPGP